METELFAHRSDTKTKALLLTLTPPHVVHETQTYGRNDCLIDSILCALEHETVLLAGSCNHCCTIHRMARHFCCRDTVTCCHDALFVQSKCYAAHGVFNVLCYVSRPAFLSNDIASCLCLKIHKYACNDVYAHFVLNCTTYYVVL